MSVNPVPCCSFFILINFIIARKKCVACQHKSNLYDSRTLFCAEKGGNETKCQRAVK